MPHDISIVIVNYLMKDDIEHCLLTLKEDLHGSTLDVKVVVVDNTPNDGCGLMLKKEYPSAVYLPQTSNLGFGKAVNVGLKAAAARYYFVCNPDTRFLPDTRTIERLYRFMEEHPKIGMIGPKLLNENGTLQYSCYRFHQFWMPFLRRSSVGAHRRFRRVVDHFLMKDFDHSQARPVDWIMGSAMFARASMMEEVGLMDERYFMYFEDADWCRRFWVAHFPVYYVPFIVIVHRHERGSARERGLIRSMIKNKLTRTHIKSWLKYMWKWRMLKI
ncbi:MAG: glycosyltransferase family 2 protein [Candidatus Magasanikbacteria bacterium]|nr:glycosyltransferase family 2 protein [Candidatus Magasanikbacteria bacterium]